MILPPLVFPAETVDISSTLIGIPLQEKLLQNNVISEMEETDTNADTISDMDVVEVDDGQVEMTAKSTADVKLSTQPKVEKEKSKNGETAPIYLDSDSEEEEVAVVSAKHL